MKLKKGDQVEIMAGKSRGMKGKISKVMPKGAKVLIPGANLYKRHLKPQGEGKPGGIVDIARPLPASSVALICPKCGKITRIGYKSGQQKLRICRKCQGII